MDGGVGVVGDGWLGDMSCIYCSVGFCLVS